MKTSLKLAFLLLIAAPSLARAQALSPGFELERAGRYADAANVYLTIVRADPINIPALLGLERVLFVLNRMPELLPLVHRARVHAPDNPALRRAATAPHSDAPYREWGLALVDHRMWDDARRAYLTGRKTLGGEGTLAMEPAELEQRAGTWEASAREWARAARARADAVRELLEGGDRVAARGVLERLATDSTAPTEAHSVAQSALLQVLIADGGAQLDVAEKQLADPKSRLSADDRAALRLALARARIARGELDRATAALGDDSSVTAVAQRGWIALYRGDLKDAMESFRLAGPYATDRAAATDRTTML